MEYTIVKVNIDNYPMFDDMVFWRVNKRERNEMEQKEIRDVVSVNSALNNENLYVYAAQSDDKFIAWISIVYIPKISWTGGKGHLFIDELWTHPDFRGKGIAYKLMKKAEVLSKEMNTLGLRLYVNPDNEAAVSLYKKLEYKNRAETLFMDKEWVTNT